MFRRALERVLVLRAIPVRVAAMVEVKVLASPIALRLAMKSYVSVRT